MKSEPKQPSKSVGGQDLPLSFMKGLLGFLAGMNAVAAIVIVLAYVLGYGDDAQRWRWTWHLGLSLLILGSLATMIRHQERQARKRDEDSVEGRDEGRGAPDE